MQVKNVLESLQKLDPELEIWLQKDEEGNGYRPANGVEEIFCIEDTYEEFVFSGPEHFDFDLSDKEDANEYQKYLEIAKKVALFW